MKRIAFLFALLACVTRGFGETNQTVSTGSEKADFLEKTITSEPEPEGNTNAEPAEAEVEDPEASNSLFTETHIYSDSVELAIESRTATYLGNVRLDDPRLQLTCERLSADVPEEGGRVERVVAETNVVITVVDDDGKTNRAFAEKAVYTYSVSETTTNEMVELSGEEQPRVERDKSILYGDVIVWDRMNDRIRAVNQRMVYRPEEEASAADLNSLLSTNANTEGVQGNLKDDPEPSASDGNE